MPTQQIKVTDASVKAHAGAVTVSATLFARFGPAPYSAWVTLGPRTLRLTPGHGRWHVRADVSVVHRSDLAAYGVSWLHHPYFVNGRRVTVVYAKPGDVVDAQQILDTAESVMPRLASRYGGGEAGLRPVIFLSTSAARASGWRTSTSARCARRPGSSTARSPTSTCRRGARCRASSRRRWSITS